MCGVIFEPCVDSKILYGELLKKSRVLKRRKIFRPKHMKCMLGMAECLDYGPDWKVCHARAITYPLTREETIENNRHVTFLAHAISQLSSLDYRLVP